MKNWMRILIYLLIAGIVLGAVYLAVRETPIRVDTATATVAPDAGDHQRGRCNKGSERLSGLSADHRAS